MGDKTAPVEMPLKSHNWVGCITAYAPPLSVSCHAKLGSEDTFEIIRISECCSKPNNISGLSHKSI
jgi:hypothetical protein